MSFKRILQIALVAAAVSTTTAFAGQKAATAYSDHNNLIYQITHIKGKAIIELPNGQRHVAKPGMKVAHGSRISVLENSVLKGIDMHNNCQVEYIECLDKPLYRDQLCATVADIRPAVVQQVVPTYTPNIVSAPVMSPVKVVHGGFSGAGLLGIGGGLLLAAIIFNDDDPKSD